MAIDRTHADELEARLTLMMEEFRAAQKRALIKRGIGLWNRTEAEYNHHTLPACAAQKDDPDS
jgi:hypothetical protein